MGPRRKPEGKNPPYYICVKKIEESSVKKFIVSESRQRRDEFMNFRMMTMIFSKYNSAVTFLSFFLLVVAKERTIDLKKVIIFDVPIFSYGWGTLRENINNFLVNPLCVHCG